MAKLFQVMEEVKTEEKLQQRRLADCHLREQIIYKVRRQQRHLADRVKQLTENKSETGLSEGLRYLMLLLLKLPFVTAG